MDLNDADNELTSGEASETDGVDGNRSWAREHFEGTDVEKKNAFDTESITG